MPTIKSSKFSFRMNNCGETELSVPGAEIGVSLWNLPMRSIVGGEFSEGHVCGALIGPFGLFSGSDMAGTEYSLADLVDD